MRESRRELEVFHADKDQKWSSKENQMKRAFYKHSRIGPLTLYRLGLGPLIGRMLLLLTTTGRKSGLPRVTPLQYEIIDGDYFIGAALGLKSDWVCNLIADPRVKLRVKNDTFTGQAEVITDVNKVADYIEYRLKQRPLMIGMILRLDGFKSRPNREELIEYAKNVAVVRIIVD
jgi:deazaflavin-dependent oxidoreductase (nitroreductase family)